MINKTLHNPAIPSIVGFFFALLLAACSSSPIAPTSPTILTTPPDLQTFHNYQGVWLRNPYAECFLACSPHLRILAFNPLGSDPFLRLGDNTYVGLRTAYMEPVGNDDSYVPCNQVAQIQRINPLTAKAVALADDLKLQLTVEVRLDPARPILHITHTLTNTSNRTRTLALWSIAALPRQGIAFAPCTAGSPPFRTFTYPAWASPDQPAITFGSRALTIDLTAPLTKNLMKIGIRNDSGFAAVLRDHTLLLSHVPVQPLATYPEAGPNITFFQMQNDAPWAELEHVSPLTLVPPHQSIIMQQTLTISQLDFLPPALTPDLLTDTLIPRP